MTAKKRICARLLRLFRQTGDEDYLKAAGALRISLLDYLELRQKILKPRRRGPAHWTRGTAQRLRRMAWAIVDKTARTPNAAARQEVEEYGSGPADTRSAVDRLRKEYAKVRSELEKDVRLEKASVDQTMRAIRVLDTSVFDQALRNARVFGAAVKWHEALLQRRRRRVPDQMLEIKSIENAPE